MELLQSQFFFFFEDVSSLNRCEAHVLFYLFFLSSSFFHAYVTTLKD